jgi:hypothetical protein
MLKKGTARFDKPAFSFPGSAWERQGRAALPLHDRPQAGRACQAGRARALPGHEGKLSTTGQSFTISTPDPFTRARAASCPWHPKSRPMHISKMDMAVGQCVLYYC